MRIISIPLDDFEIKAMVSHHAYWAYHYEASEQTQYILAEKYKNDPDHAKWFFTRSPLKGEPQTEKNYLKRAAIFKQWKEARQQRIKQLLE